MEKTIGYAKIRGEQVGVKQDISELHLVNVILTVLRMDVVQKSDYNIRI